MTVLDSVHLTTALSGNRGFVEDQIGFETVGRAARLVLAQNVNEQITKQAERWHAEDLALQSLGFDPGVGQIEVDEIPIGHIHEGPHQSILTAPPESFPCISVMAYVSVPSGDQLDRMDQSDLTLLSRPTVWPAQSQMDQTRPTRPSFTGESRGLPRQFMPRSRRTRRYWARSAERPPAQGWNRKRLLAKPAAKAEQDRDISGTDPGSSTPCNVSRGSTRLEGGISMSDTVLARYVGNADNASRSAAVNLGNDRPMMVLGGAPVELSNEEYARLSSYGVVLEDVGKGYDELTVDELKSQLSQAGVEYSSDDKKADLVKLLRGQSASDTVPPSSRAVSPEQRESTVGCLRSGRQATAGMICHAGPPIGNIAAEIMLVMHVMRV
jgi:hypothetical protein